MEKKIDLITRGSIGGTELITNLKKVNQNIYALGSGIDSTNRWKTYFIKFNEGGDSLYSKVFTDTVQTSASKFIHKDNHLYILQWYEVSLPNDDVRILKTDTFGNIVDEWYYGSNLRDVSFDFKMTPDNGFILAGNSNSYTVDGNQDFLLLKIDSVGNVEWQKTYGNTNEETVRPYNSIETTQDGGYIMCGEEDISTMSSFNVQAIILKVDENGDSLWKKELDLAESYTIASNIREWNDGSIMVSGSVRDNTNPNPIFNSAKGYVLKLSSNGNTTIWERRFSKDWTQGNDYHRGLMLTSDGGILSTGWTGGIGNDGWVVKFDSCGYTVGDIPEPLLIIDSVKGKTVYITEQSTNYCSASIDWGDGTETLKYYAYQNNEPLQERHYFHTYNEIDDYTITTTTLAGEEFRDYSVQVLGLSNSSIGTVMPKQAGISLFPNPANDYVIIENQIPLLRGARGVLKATINNLSGKQIKTQNLNAKLYQQKVDVSSLNNGVYLVRFEVDGVLIATEKLVVAR